MTTITTITDQDRADFLRKLDGSVLSVTDWERRFITSFLQQYRDWQFWTDARRTAADRMRLKYGKEPEINMPLQTPEVKRLPIPAADAGCCDYLVKGEDGRQRPCNEPATCREPDRLRYCDAHGQFVKRGCPKIALVRL